MRAGYQDKPDAMRDLADKLMSNSGTAADVIQSAPVFNADKQKMRMYNKGGAVKKPKKDTKCFAMGGVGKIRHEQATKDGKQKKVVQKKPIV